MRTDEMTSAPTRRSIIGPAVVVVFTIWFVVVLIWATRPIVDHVSVIDANDSSTQQSVGCNAPLSGSARDDEPLPELKAGEVYEREPCVSPYREARRLLVVDALFYVALLGGAAVWWSKRQAHRD